MKTSFVENDTIFLLHLLLVIPEYFHSFFVVTMLSVCSGLLVGGHGLHCVQKLKIATKNK